MTVSISLLWRHIGPLNAGLATEIITLPKITSKIINCILQWFSATTFYHECLSKDILCTAPSLYICLKWTFSFCVWI